MLNDEIVALQSDAEQLGVLIEIDLQDDCLWLSEIRRHSGCPGSGAKILSALIDIAEQNDMPIKGCIVENHEPLLAYYSEFGFEPEYETSSNGKIEKIRIEYVP